MSSSIPAMRLPPMASKVPKPNIPIPTPSPRVPTIPIPTPSPRVPIPTPSPRAPTIPIPTPSPRAPTIPIPTPSPKAPTIKPSMYSVSGSIKSPLVPPMKSGYVPPMRSPMVPSIGIPKRVAAKTPSTILQPGENPWLVVNPNSNTEINIAALTPIGTIAMVPTAIRKAVPTPRRLGPSFHWINPEPEKEESNNPILDASIYLNFSEVGNKEIAERMRSISTGTMNLQKQYVNYLQEMPNISGLVTHAKFEELLSIYENNQVYYQDKIEDGTLDHETIAAKLTELEHWFIKIAEPQPLDRTDISSWKDRNNFKEVKGITLFCDPELYSYITPVKY